MDAATPGDDIRSRMRDVSERQQRLERQWAERLGVDAAGLATMHHLGRTGSATPTELARHLDVSTAAMTLVLNRLQDAGHVTRDPHPSDRRKVVVAPAPTSLAAALELVQPVITGVEAVAEGMSAADRAVVARFLAAVATVYDGALDGRAPTRP